jgi:hypothetical protein
MYVEGNIFVLITLVAPQVNIQEFFPPRKNERQTAVDRMRNTTAMHVGKFWLGPELTREGKQQARPEAHSNSKFQTLIYNPNSC